MKSHITGLDLANTVRMAHLQRRVTFVLVEGETDLYCLRTFILCQFCEILVCHGRDNVFQAVESLDGSQEPGFLAVVDADYDLLEGKGPASANCIFTDFRDLIMVLFSSRALEKLLIEKGSPMKIAAFEAQVGKPVRDAILECARPLGYLRWLNRRGGLNLVFRDLNVAKAVDRETLSLDFVRVTQVLAQRSPGDHNHVYLMDQVVALTDPSHDPRYVCCGHDAVSILGLGLRKAIGSQTAIHTEVDVLERDLRLAFDWDCFEKTLIHDHIRSWEQQNPGWPVLAPRNQV